jgi:hypothetical protein
VAPARKPPADRRAKRDDNDAGRHGVDDERRCVERGADGRYQLPVGTIGKDASDRADGQRGAGLDRHDQADRRRRRSDVGRGL